ncbi:Holliday junction branch migration protein RuvA [Candidatus Bipolaricaulota bacterium]|nr:Holliday junction branch migration protein RuvA [Candidatus Bipolaricaulota bacterium]
MIDSITGRVIRIESDHLVVETGGIAYRVSCPVRSLTTYRQGEEGLVYVHMSVRDDGISLFGFASFREREIFCSLLPIGQVGPRLALQVLSTLSPDEFITAVACGDVERLTAVKGVGKKTAQRILIELRDKLTSDLGTPLSLPLSAKEETAIRALTSKSLGFSAREARRALERLRGEDLPVEELVRRALETIGS